MAYSQMKFLANLDPEKVSDFSEEVSKFLQTPGELFSLVQKLDKLTRELGDIDYMGTDSKPNMIEKLTSLNKNLSEVASLMHICSIHVENLGNNADVFLQVLKDTPSK